MRNRKGFTLVELVIVIAIIGILAALLVPTMMGYIKKARLRQCNMNAKVAYNVMMDKQAVRIMEGLPYDIEVGEIDLRGDTPIPNNELTQEIYAALASNGKGSGIMYVGKLDGHTDTNDDVKMFVHWIMTPNDTAVGQYPDPPEDLAHVPTYKTYNGG